ncbi:MAG: hypothetical protein V1809_02025 [Planctomycetota bacterium]
MNILAILLSLIFPGGGQLIFRRELAGALLAIPFYALAIPAVAQEANVAAFPVSSRLLEAAAALVWLAALAHTAAIVVRRSSRRRGEERDRLFAKAQDLYLKNDLPETAGRLAEILRSDPADADAWQFLASVREKQNRPKDARKALENRRYFDVKGKWRMMDA